VIERAMNEESLFAEALGKQGAARAAFLDEHCKGDAALRQRLDGLLQAHDHPDPFLEAAAPLPTVDEPLREGVGTVIGPYKLVEQIGEGGMGTVWMAQQTEPVKRVVAVKLIKAGLDSRQVIARFEAERQALALMDHPNIARVLDGGTTTGGRPYFVMDLVKGVPITRYCDEHRLTPRQRLELFIPVCQAIQHAHQKGVIHRDLKPSNVLVALYDGKPVPKVIDFGVAKAAGQSLTDKTLVTGFGNIIGTLEYMSPEQAEINQLDIDTRSDIYSLGVLLYELLTGSPPFSRKDLEKAGMLEMLRVIREQEPSKPSTKLSTADGLPTLAANRGTEPAKLTKLVRGELDWIVMKALEKDRNRRYESANGFAMDVQRYLADEPVLACPPSAGYRLQKFARKYRKGLVTVALFALLLIAGTVLSAWQAVRATRAAEGERRSKLDAQAANEQAQKRLMQVEKGNEILTSIFADLDMRKVREGTDPLEAVLAKGLLKASTELEGEAVGDALVVARLENRLGLTLMGLGYPREAIPLFIKARETFTAKLGDDHPSTLDSMNNLGRAYHDDGKLDLALPLLEETLKRRKARLADDDPDTLISMNNLAGGYWAAGKPDLALPLWEETLKLRKARLGPDDPETLASMNNLALGYQDTGKLDLALPLFQEALKRITAKLGADHLYTLNSMNNLAVTYLRAGQLALALPLLEETLKLRRARLGVDHPGTLASMNTLCTGYLTAKKLDRALPLLEETRKACQARFGVDHAETLRSMSNLAQGYKMVGKVGLAIPLLEETLKRQQARLGADHRETFTTMINLVAAYQAAGKPDFALPLLEEGLKRRKTKLGPDHADTLSAMNELATAYQAAGKLDQAVPLLEETLRLRRAKFGPDHPDTLVSLNNLAGGYQAAGKLPLALPLLQEAAAAAEKQHFHLEGAATILDNLTFTYEQLQQFDQAEAWRRKWLAIIGEQFGADSPAYASQLSLLGLNLLRQKKWTDAETVMRDCLAIRQKHEPDSWTTFNARSMLGGALLGQKKYGDAEPLLLEGYEGMKQRAAKIPAQGRTRLTEALERLVQLYGESGKKDKADEWRKQLDAQKKPSAR
jgi:serine/threonine protein kinase/tetratricopeptide (TPR) repeat protein